MPSRARNRAIRVDIPVDLRAFFRSETVRNFYGMTYVAYTPAEIEADEDSAKTSATSPDAAGSPKQYLKEDMWKYPQSFQYPKMCL